MLKMGTLGSTEYFYYKGAKRMAEEAAAADEAGEERVILFNLCGHGNFDLAAYDAYLAGTPEDPEFSESDMQAALANLPSS